MRTDEVTRRSGIQIGPEATLAQAAELMEQAGVGAARRCGSGRTRRHRDRS